MSDYYSVDGFLAENQRLPCTFLNDLPDMGYLAGSDKDLAANTTVELPFWLGLDLASVNDREFLVLGMPKPFASRVRNALVASAQSVNLRALSPTFYRSGVRLDQVISDDNLKHVLYKTFRDRLEEVFDQAQHASSVPRSIAEGAAVGGGNRPIAQQPMDDKAADFVAGMDEWEKELHMVAEQAAKATLVWSTRRFNA